MFMEKSQMEMKKTQKKTGFLAAFMGIVRGDFLFVQVYKRHGLLLLLIFILAILNISNRYSGQKELIEISNLRDSLKDVRYSALVRLSEVTTEKRQSNIERKLKSLNSDVKISNHTPYIIEENE